MRGEITCFLFGSPGEGEILHRGEKLLIYFVYLYKILHYMLCRLFQSIHFNYFPFSSNHDLQVIVQMNTS